MAVSILRSPPPRPVQTYLTAHLVEGIPGLGHSETHAGPAAEAVRKSSAAPVEHATSLAKKRMRMRSWIKRRVASVSRYRRKIIRDAGAHTIEKEPVAAILSPTFDTTPSVNAAHTPGIALAVKTKPVTGAAAHPGKAANGIGANGPGAGRASGPGGDLSAAHAAYGEDPAPQYPEMARELAQEGVVMLRVLVGIDGSVRRVQLAKSSGFDMLDSVALDTVREEWRFVPARRGKVAVASWVLVPIRFTLTSGLE
ncbi:MAG: energy transducer TonB [Candidatus Binataceae bacterium]